MAKNKRMFASSVVGTDDFLDMPAECQALYFHLGMEADDDGFVSPKVVMRKTNAADDSLKVLIGKGFVFPVDGGVMVIRHWRTNNYLRKDRYTPTVYQQQLAQLRVQGGCYLDSSKRPLQLAIKSGIPDGIPLVAEERERDSKKEAPETSNEAVETVKEEIRKLAHNFANPWGAGTKPEQKQGTEPTLPTISI